MKTKTAQQNYFEKLFIDHPQSVDETYFEHMGVALKFAGMLLVAATAALIHAIIPAACEKTASNIIRNLYGKTRNRGHQTH